jgi:ABC-type antimicrobial peptide transport system permease subunit
MQGKRLGWDREHLVYVPLGRDLKKSYDVLKNELVKDSHVLGVTASMALPSNIGSNSSGVDWDGKDPELTVLVGQNSVDFDFVETLRIEMAEGRSFSREYANDNGKTFIVNEEVAKIMGKDSVVGERFHFGGVDGTIVGVMKNFHFKPVRDKIEPLALIVDQRWTNVMLIRISPGNVSDSLSAIENIWKKVIPAYPFESYFMDENFDRMYRAEEKIGTLMQYFAILAVFIACLGLFGLASFTAEQRTKEIGIRKVLGASVSNITTLLCREFLLLVILANAIAWPAAYFVMKRWLQSYAYRTNLDVLFFLAALGVAVGVAILSVGFQALRAATSNPTDSLRYE